MSERGMTLIDSFIQFLLHLFWQIVTSHWLKMQTKSFLTTMSPPLSSLFQGRRVWLLTWCLGTDLRGWFVSSPCCMLFGGGEVLQCHLYCCTWIGPLPGCASWWVWFSHWLSFWGPPNGTHLDQGFLHLVFMFTKGTDSSNQVIHSPKSRVEKFILLRKGRAKAVVVNNVWTTVLNMQ